MRSMSMEPAGSPVERAGTEIDSAPDQDAGDAAFDLSMAVSQLASNSTDLRIMLKLLVSQLAERPRRPHRGGAGRGASASPTRSSRCGSPWVTTASRPLVDGASVRCSIGHSSGGIRIRSEQVGMDVWLTRLLATLQAEAAHSEQTRLALENIVIGGQS